jgi:3-hydroxyanthranilic acid dioxygenase
MLLRVVEDGSEFRDIKIGEGEMFLLPGAATVFNRYYTYRSSSMISEHPS